MRLYPTYLFGFLIPLCHCVLKSSKHTNKAFGRTDPVITNNTAMDIKIIYSDYNSYSIDRISQFQNVSDWPELNENINGRSKRATRRRNVCSSSTGMSWTKYHSSTTIYRFIQCLASKYKLQTTVYDIGKSSEGTVLKVIRVRTKGRRDKPAIWIDGGFHAREWISPATVTYILNQLVENSASHKSLLDRVDVFVLPLVNPDGYKFSRFSDRHWRKTRSRRGGKCVGVDLNRNFSYKWGGADASDNPCHETYRGPRPFSEPEARAVRDFIVSKRRFIKMYLTFHSWGQLILYPWGYGKLNIKDRAELHRMGQVGASAMRRPYAVGSNAATLYPSAGGSSDWAKGVAGIKYSYIIELPDTGKHGFRLPESFIMSVAKEAFRGTKAMAIDLVDRL